MKRMQRIEAVMFQSGKVVACADLEGFKTQGGARVATQSDAGILNAEVFVYCCATCGDYHGVPNREPITEH